METDELREMKQQQNTTRTWSDVCDVYLKRAAGLISDEETEEVTEVQSGTLSLLLS